MDACPTISATCRPTYKSKSPRKVRTSRGADASQEIGLVFFHSTVMIRGKNPQDLAVQFAGERVASIREFDPQKLERPAREEPIIERIEVTTKVTAPLSEERKKEA